MKFCRAFSLISLAIVLLTSCASFRKTPPIPEKLHNISWQKRIIQLGALKQWSARGVLSFTFKKTAEFASFEWLQNEDDYKIKIVSPLNLMQIYIDGNQRQVTLWKSKDIKYAATSPEILLEKQIGFIVPISNLLYWIKGMPSPHARYKIKLDYFNHAVVLEQQGWTIRYSQFSSQNSFDLPVKLELKNDKLNIKMSIRNWETYAK